jgi:Lrp/AsnC family transcriptional regulator
MVKIDKIDRKIIRILQEDATLANAEVADRVGLSANACWRRTKKLEEDQVIRKQVALIRDAAVDLNLTAFVAIKTNQHDDAWLKTFAQGIKAIPEVIEFYRLSGDTDYLLKVVAKDIEDYDRVYKELIKVTPLHDVSSSFAMERIKSTTALPV